jgi:hypothetical protein
MPDSFCDTDKTGCSDWEEAKQYAKIIPVTMKHDQVDFLATREIKHETTRVCIDSARQTLSPLVMTFDRRALGALLNGIREGMDLAMHVRRSTYVDASIFMIACEIFSFQAANASVEQIRIRILQPSCLGGIVSIIYSHCLFNYFLYEGKIIMFPPHSTHKLKYSIQSKDHLIVKTKLDKLIHIRWQFDNMI